jgi:hypothetical protein
MNKAILSVFSCLLLVTFPAMAQNMQYITLGLQASSSSTNSVSYPVGTNQIITVVSSNPGNYYPATYGTFANGATSVIGVIGIITGLINIKCVTGAELGNSNPSYQWTTFQITTPSSAAVISNYVPADAIVIPSSATGTVQIILESSPDLVNWTAANPGTYGASSGTNRFFRVRAVCN